MVSPSEPGAEVVPRLIAALALQPIPHEGAWFAPVARSGETVTAAAARYPSDRASYSVIHTLITPTEFSALHRLASDEIWQFCSGSPIELLLLHPDGRSETVVLGPDVLRGHHAVTVVPRGVWQGARLSGAGTGFALLSHTVIPAFEYADYEPGVRSELIERYPDRAGHIAALTREPSDRISVGVARSS